MNSVPFKSAGAEVLEITGVSDFATLLFTPWAAVLRESLPRAVTTRFAVLPAKPARVGPTNGIPFTAFPITLDAAPPSILVPALIMVSIIVPATLSAVEIEVPRPSRLPLISDLPQRGA